jgi:hypothetical protein
MGTHSVWRGLQLLGRYSAEGEPIEPRRVLLVIGDGHDTASKKSLDEVLELAQRNLVTIYGKMQLNTPTGSVPFDTCTHVAGTWDGITMRAYINGVQRASVVHRGSIKVTDDRFQVSGAVGVQSLGQRAIERHQLQHREIQDAAHALGDAGFAADGAGTFANPRYRIHGRIDGLFIKDEGIGQVSGRLSVRDDLLSIEQLEAASPRLAISGTGRIALTKGADADLNLRFNQTSLEAGNSPEMIFQSRNIR